MADATYPTGFYVKQGGLEAVVATDGSLDVESGGEWKIAGTAVTSTAAELNILDGVTATAAEINNACDVSARVEEHTASGAITAGFSGVELNHASVAIAATIADAVNHAGLFWVYNTSSGGTEAHTLTLTAGTFDGTNNVATLNAPDEALLVYFNSAGKGLVVLNSGSVALS